MLDRYTHFSAWYVSRLRFAKQWFEYHFSTDPIGTVLTDSQRDSVRDTLAYDNAKSWLNSLGLAYTLEYLETAKTEFAVDKLKLSDAITVLTQLADRLMSELKESWQIHVPHEFVAMYNKPLEFWGVDFPAKFPTAYADAFDTARCFGASRPTAAVFHSMRVLEVGLKALATKLGVPYKRQDKSWASVLTAIQEKIDEKYPAKGLSTANKTRRRVYHQMASHFNTFMKAWRDFTVHNPVRYKKQSASEIIAAVRAFMQAIVADGLSEKPKKTKKLPDPIAPLPMPPGS